MYSVRKYFGFLRATGIDHFEPKYKDIPFERRGIFKWTPNAMYVFGIGIPFTFAVATGSQSMFVVAIYHLYFWLAYIIFVLKKKTLKLYTVTIKFHKIPIYDC